MQDFMKRLQAWAVANTPPPPVKPQQIIRTYHGANLDAQFRSDANRLAAQGYVVQGSPTYGGFRRAGLGSWVTLGIIGGRKPKQMTVIYVLSSPDK